MKQWLMTALSTLMLWVGIPASVVYAQGVLRLSMVDGLPNNRAMGITQDSLGYVWVATEGGLVRYDGFRFTSFTTSNSNISSNELNAVLATSDGLFVATQRDGLCRYDAAKNSFETWRTADGLQHDGITHLAPATDGGIWVCYYQDGIDHRAQDGTLTHLRAADIPALRANNWTAVEDGRGHLYIGHVTEGLTELTMDGRHVTSVRRYRHRSHDAHSIASDAVHAVLAMPDGTIWVGTGDGLSVLDPATGQFVNYRHSAAVSHSIACNSIIDMMMTANGDVWIGHSLGGVSVVDAKEVRHALAGTMRFADDLNQKPMNLAGISVVSLFEDKAGNRWLAPERQGVAVLRHLPPRFEVQPRQPHDFGVFSADLAPQFARALPQLSRIDPSFSFIQDYCTDGTTTWVGTTEGLFRIEDGLLRKDTLISSQLSVTNINSLAIDRHHQLWLGTFGGGVEVFTRDGRLVCRPQGLPSTAVNAVRGDRKGRIWVGTRNGLLCFADPAVPDSFSVLTHADGLADPFIRAIVEDTDGNIWVSCNKGISRVDGRLSAQSPVLSNYAIRDGLPGEEFVKGYAKRLPDGRLAFGTKNYTIVCSPRQLAKAIAVAPITISGITVYGSNADAEATALWMPGTDGLTLRHDEGTLKVSLGIADVAQAHLLDFQYRLVGLDDTWHVLENGQSELTLYGLPHGRYRLCIRARIHDQAWSREELSLDIHILPPFYLSWWAWTLYIVAVILIGYWLIHAYVERLRIRANLRSEQERMTFYTHAAHELRTPLTLIVGPLEDMMNAAGEEGGTVQVEREKLSLIHRNAQQLLTLVNKMMFARRMEESTQRLQPTPGNLATLVAETGMRFKELNGNADVNYVIETGTDIGDTLFDREAVTIILNNLLSNAAKYTSAGTISLTLQQQPPRAVITVSDTGHGIPAAALPHLFQPYVQAGGRHQQAGTGLGLSLVKRLATLHGGTVSVESTEGVGTTFSVELAIPPAVPQTQQTEHSAASAAHTPPSADIEAGDDVTLLIVEDNADIRQYIADAFQGEYKVLTATDGEQGLRLAEKHMPDVVISDVMMPRMDGTELVRRLKSTVSTSHIPVVLLTAKSTIADKEEGLESGADAYLTKPFSIRLLKAQVANLMAQRQRLVTLIQENIGSLAGTDVAEKQLHINNLDREFLKKLDAFIDLHMAEESLDVARLAEAMGMSQSTLYRKLKSLTGLNATDYLKKTRLRHAAALLREGHNVSEAAMRCGFGNMSYFSKVFKAETGVLPSQYS